MKTELTARQPIYQRKLKEKFARFGLEEFLDSEVMNLLFSYSRPIKENSNLIEFLLSHYGSLKNILNASLEELVAQPGMDGNTAILLKLLKDGSEFYLKDKITKQNSRMSWSEILEYCRVSMGGLKEEHFKVIFLDNKNSICGVETLQKGTIDQSVIYPRTVIKRALANNAQSLIFVHNHPSGDPAPSTADIEITQLLFKVAKGIDIEVLDHLIIGSDKYYSFHNSGLLSDLD
jgi:DNA repair protein RadC